MPGFKIATMFVNLLFGLIFCNNIFDIMASAYPRIDLHQKCPQVLGAHIKGLFKN